MDDPAVIDEGDLLARIKELGLADGAHAALAARATLRALGECLPAPERTALSGALPARLAGELGAYRGPGEAEQLFVRVRDYEGTSAGFAREHAEIVCQALAEMLPAEVAFRVRRALAPSIAALIEPSAAPGEPPPYVVPHGERHHTLATGAPGSRHPISEAPPPGPQSESVGAANPHEDSKVSSASGLTQEQTQESLSTEVPRTDRTISESHD